MEHVSLHAFLTYLFSGVPDELYTALSAFSVSGERSTPLTQAFPVSNLEAAYPWIETHRKTYDLYFRPSLLASPPLVGRGKESDTVGAILLWADLDLYKSTMSVDQAYTFLEQSGVVPPCTAIVSTGGGLHAYWKLDTFCRDVASMKGRNHWLKERLLAFGADGVSDYARVLRLPETFNYKKGGKRLVSVLSFSPERLYSLEDFGWIAPGRSTSKVMSNGHTPHAPLLAPSVLDADFLAVLEERNPHLCNRIYTEESARRERAHLDDQGNVDNSRNDFQIALGLLRLGYPESHIVAVLSHPTWFSGQKYREKGNEVGASYVQLTITKAKELPRVDVDQFFEGKKFIPLKMLNYLIQQNAHFLMHNMELWVYDVEDGVYRGSGEAYIRHEVASLLAGHWKSSYATDTVTLCKDTLYDDYLAELRNLSSPERTSLEHLTINVRSGMLNLATSALTPHAPTLRSIVQYPVHSIAQIETLRTPVEAFIEDVLQADCIPAWWEWVGYHFLSDTRFRRALMVIGMRLSGKSTLLGLLERFLGPQNTTAFTLQALCDDRFAASGLVGKIANIYNDLDMVELKHPGNLKVFVSGERVGVEKKFVPAFEAYLTAKHSYSANGFVPVSDPDDAFISRWLIMRLVKQFNEGGEGEGEQKANVQLLDQLTTPENMAAMLYLAQDGLRRLCRQEHFSVGASMQEAQDDYHAHLDSVFAFLNACTRRDSSGFITKQELYQAYVHYCGFATRGVLKDRRFFMRMQEQMKKMHITDGRKSIDGKVYYGFHGITLVSQTTMEAKKRGMSIIKKRGDNYAAE